MSKQKENLLKRLEAVSKNNVAYVEAYGADKHWGEHKREIEALPVKQLKSEIEKLEEALENVNLREENAKLKKQVAKQAAEKKLEALGITKEDLMELLRG